MDSVKRRAYVANTNSNTVSVIDTSTSAVIATISTGESPAGIAVDEGSHRVFTANLGDSSTTVIDGFPDTPVAIGTFAILAGALGVVVDPGTYKAFINDSSGGDVAVFNGTTLTVDEVVARIGPPDELGGG